MNALDRPHTQLGGFELSIVSDGTYVSDGGAMFGVVPKSLWSRRVKVDERNLVHWGLNSVLVRTGKQTVLIETGIGNKLPAKTKSYFEPQELLLKDLAAAGVGPEAVDIVINSHLHFDHCGWNTVIRDGVAVPTFPNARYFAQMGDWEHGSRQLERDRVSYLSDNYDPLIRSGQMTLLDGAAEIVPGISVEIWPGHTRHMQAIFLRSGGRTACYISDLVPTSHHLDITWVLAYDLFPLEVIENRKRYYQRAIPEKWLTIFTHDHELPWAYLKEEKAGKPVVDSMPGS